MSIESHRESRASRIEQTAPIDVILAALLGLMVTVTTSGSAQTYQVLYSFTGGADGGDPVASLTVDTAGNLYGTAAEGGDLSCGISGGCGVVFKLDPSGVETVLHTFTGPDGAVPIAGLLRDAAGNLYGNTGEGGAYGYGAVFKLNTTGQETVLYSFSGGEDGLYPWYDTLIRDSAGNLYGTTTGGGMDGDGAVFSVGVTGAETVVHSFTGTPDGEAPTAGLTYKAGAVYGTTCCGGAYGTGTVFKVDSGSESVLYSFADGSDGAYPNGALLPGLDGDWYGTASEGGEFLCGLSYGCGVVFRLDSTGHESVLHTFEGRPDGALPIAGLIRDDKGDLYGTTYEGGTHDRGVVFELDAKGQETILHNFKGADGGNPIAGLVRDTAGNLYGAAQNGGAFGHGVIFKLAPK